MATEDNLKEAFAGESQANRRYLAFAKKADADGKPGIARLFRAAAAAETICAFAVAWASGRSLACPTAGDELSFLPLLQFR